MPGREAGRTSREAQSLQGFCQVRDDAGDRSSLQFSAGNFVAGPWPVSGTPSGSRRGRTHSTAARASAGQATPSDVRTPPERCRARSSIFVAADRCATPTTDRSHPSATHLRRRASRRPAAPVARDAELSPGRSDTFASASSLRVFASRPLGLVVKPLIARDCGSSPLPEVLLAGPLQCGTYPVATGQRISNAAAEHNDRNENRGENIEHHLQRPTRPFSRGRRRPSRARARARVRARVRARQPAASGDGR